MFVWRIKMLSTVLNKKIRSHKCRPCHPTIEFYHPSENCAVITFEGGGSLTPIPDIDIGFTLVSFPEWITTIDIEAGGVARTANEPSPETTATFICLPNFRDIIFTNPVSSIKLFYASEGQVIIEAYDENDNFLGSDSGAANYGTGANPPCDHGCFNRFDELSINIDRNSIFRLRVNAIENETAIDDLTICVGVRGLIVEGA
jgi:hypothetical protein